jgi:hypothetical protein
VQFDVDTAGHGHRELERLRRSGFHGEGVLGLECTCSSSSVSLVTSTMIGWFTEA